MSHKVLAAIVPTIILLPLFDTALTNCSISTCSETKWGYSYSEFDRYDVVLDHTTTAGTLYDPSAQNISPLLIDRLTHEVDVCLTDLGYSPINYQSFSVKVVGDWVLNCSGTQQELPDPVWAGNGGCVSKGQAPSIACPCRWRAGIKCPNIILTTPSFYLYKDALTRFVVGTDNPWASPELAKCASPSTTPLSNGSDPNNGLLTGQ